MDLVDLIYGMTNKFPKREVYSLTDQIRRPAVSIPSSIAEGQGHFTNGEFLHFLRHARGSLAELETQGLIAQRHKYVEDEECKRRCKKTRRTGPNSQRVNQRNPKQTTEGILTRYQVLGTRY